jgi:hypothetical protein
MPVAKDPRLDQLETRRLASVGHQIDNDTLPAGSPMYYYCKCCGIHVATMPEDWYRDPPPTYCVNCKDLISDGVVARDDTFEQWDRQREATASGG